MKNALLPRIKKVCISTTLLSVRVNSLICLGKLLTHLDKWIVIDDILPMLHQIPSREPAVIMGIIGDLCCFDKFYCKGTLIQFAGYRSSASRLTFGSYRNKSCCPLMTERP